MVRPIKPSEVETRRNARTGIRVSNSKICKKRFYFTHLQIFLITILVVVFLGSSIGYVWSNFEGTRIGYDLSRLQQEEMRLRDLNRKLKIELATLKSPQSIEKAARAIGLREAQAEQIVILE